MHSALSAFAQGGIQQLRGQDEGGGVQKLTVFVHAKGIKIVHVYYVSKGLGGWVNKIASIADIQYSIYDN